MALQTWVIQTTAADTNGKFTEDRVTAEALQVNPDGSIMLGGPTGLLAGYQRDAWRKFRLSNIQPATVGGNA